MPKRSLADLSELRLTALGLFKEGAKKDAEVASELGLDRSTITRWRGSYNQNLERITMNKLECDNFMEKEAETEKTIIEDKKAIISKLIHLLREEVEGVSSLTDLVQSQKMAVVTGIIKSLESYKDIEIVRAEKGIVKLVEEFGLKRTITAVPVQTVLTASGATA